MENSNSQLEMKIKDTEEQLNDWEEEMFEEEIKKEERLNRMCESMEQEEETIYELGMDLGFFEWHFVWSEDGAVSVCL